MNTKVNKLPKNLVELTVELSAEEMQPFVRQATAELTRGVSIPGFRPGKAPYNMLVQKIGGEMKIYQEAAEKAMSDSYPKAVIDNKLVAIGQPKISIEKLAPLNPFIYKATVALLPKVKLGNYKKIKINKREVKVEAKDVEVTLQNLQKMFGKEKRVKRSIQKGDKAEIDFDTYLDKIAIDGGTSKNHPVAVGEGQFIPGFEDNLIGLIEGQTKEFKLKFPKEYHKKELANREVEFKVKVNSVFEVELPKLDDEFAKSAGKFEKFDDLRRQIERNIHQERKEKEHQRWELAVVDELIKRSEFEEIPDLLLESELHKMLHELEDEVIKQGMKFEDYLSSIKKSREDLEKEFRPQAERRVKTAIALREIARAEKITVSDEEVNKQVEDDKPRYQNNPEILKQINSEDYRDYVKNVLRTRKVFEYLEGVNKG